ncbi:hypothetical protein CAPTEDRAFT_213449 [Capitella teleta]|uniref:Reverse transcriptase domain-containing protein n=1 Tax=Capitella teleta TaxID=283909 RepID=R7VHB5_CAPTE|nr:hypothetical protein CAPTEDRAFT_213449 [Capitella teleta]|eukprot:ELU18213.1 hypothetical protein CAPTEDRAFT_213449 [Capitella teleta]
MEQVKIVVVQQAAQVTALMEALKNARSSQMESSSASRPSLKAFIRPQNCGRINWNVSKCSSPLILFLRKNAVEPGNQADSKQNEPKLGEMIPELAARIRHEATTCDFMSIKNPLDDATVMQFMCFVSNEAVLKALFKALFKVMGDALTFTKAFIIAMAMEDAATFTKKNCTGNEATSDTPDDEAEINADHNCLQAMQQGAHRGKCRLKDSTCNHCGIKCHLEQVCRKKAAASRTANNKQSSRIGINKVLETKPDAALQQACKNLCDKFPNLFKEGLGVMKNLELEIKFKDKVKSVFHKTRTVRLVIQDDLVQAYEAGIKRESNTSGTSKGQTQSLWRLFRHSESTVGATSSPNAFTQMTDAQAFWWIWIHKDRPRQCLQPDSTWSKGAPDSAEIMEQLTEDLFGVAIYFDDILVSGNNSEEHLE